MNKNLLIATLTGQLVASCINHSGIDNINDVTITKCKDLASKILVDIEL